MSSELARADRREFLKKTGLGAVAAGALLSGDGDAAAQGASAMRQLTPEEKLSRIASSCWPPRFCFKSIGNRAPSEEAVAMKKKYGEITMLDFPQWTKDTYPGVYHLDLWSDVFGDPADPTQYQENKVTRDNGQTVSVFRWDPALPSSKKWLETWDRWKTPEKDWNDVARNVRILNAHRYRGTICIEYEHGPVDGIEGSKQLMNEVLAAL